MAPQLPVISGAQVARAFEKLGWRIVRQRGSDIILVKDGQRASLSVPNHREVAKGTLRGLIRASGQTLEEFMGQTN